MPVVLSCKAGATRWWHEPARGAKKIPDRNPVGEEFTETNIKKYSLDKRLAQDYLQLTYIFVYFLKDILIQLVMVLKIWC